MGSNRTAKQYGSSLIEAIEERLPRPLKRMNEQDLFRFVYSLDSAAIERFLVHVMRAHKDHAGLLPADLPALAPDEACALDASVSPFSEQMIGKFLLYHEAVLVPDPLLEHPLVLRAVLPDHFHTVYPYSLGKLQGDLLDGLEFYRKFSFPISEGIILPTHWHLLVALEATAHNTLVSSSNSRLFPSDDLGSDLTKLADDECRVHPAMFHDGRLTLHDFDHQPKQETSQIAIKVSGDPDYAHIAMETYLRSEDIKKTVDGVTMRQIQAPPPTEEEFDAWANASKRKVIYNRMVSLRTDVLYATCLNASIVTPASVNWSILRHLGGDSLAAAVPSSALMEMKIPTIEGVSINTITKAREDSEALANFRTAFRGACKAIRAELGSPQFKRESDAIARDIVDAGVRDIRQSYRAFRKKAASDVLLTAVSAVVTVGAVSLGQLAFVPALLGLANQVKSIRDAAVNEDELKKKPMYMLWKMSRKPFSEG